MYCHRCRYPLAQLPTPRCPECGREFDSADPDTYLSDLVHHPITLALAVAPGRLLNGLMLALAIILVAAVSAPMGASQKVGFACVQVGQLLLLCWLTKAFARMRVSLEWPRREWAAWCFAPLAASLALALLYFDIPRRAMFVLALPRLSAVVAAIEKGHGPPEDFWAGPVFIARVDRFAGWIRFRTGRGDGFIYTGENLPAYRNAMEITPLGGNWYAWYFETQPRAAWDSNWFGCCCLRLMPVLS